MKKTFAVIFLGILVFSNCRAITGDSLKVKPFEITFSAGQSYFGTYFGREDNNKTFRKSVRCDAYMYDKHMAYDFTACYNFIRKKRFQLSVGLELLRYKYSNIVYGDNYNVIENINLRLPVTAKFIVYSSGKLSSLIFFGLTADSDLFYSQKYVEVSPFPGIIYFNRIDNYKHLGLCLPDDMGINYGFSFIYRFKPNLNILAGILVSAPDASIPLLLHDKSDFGIYCRPIMISTGIQF